MHRERRGRKPGADSRRYKWFSCKGANRRTAGRSDETRMGKPGAPQGNGLYGGQASAFNAAVPELAGQIVAFLDGDDWFAPSKLSAVMKEFEKNPEIGGVAHGFYEFHEDTQETKVCAPESRNFLNLTTAAAAR